VQKIQKTTSNQLISLNKIIHLFHPIEIRRPSGMHRSSEMHQKGLPATHHKAAQGFPVVVAQSRTNE
jgi:hypothetical protein